MNKSQEENKNQTKFVYCLKTCCFIENILKWIQLCLHTVRHKYIRKHCSGTTAARKK